MYLNVFHIKCVFWNLPSELDDFSASVCAANAFVRSNKSSWNCLESVVVDKSTDLKILKIK